MHSVSFVLPEAKYCLIDLPNLTRVKIDSRDKQLKSFECELPQNVRALGWRYDELNSLKIKQPKLSLANLSLNNIRSLGELDLPDSVQEVALSMQRLAYGTSEGRAYENRLPVDLKRLDLSANNMDTQSFNKLNLKRFRQCIC